MKIYELLDRVEVSYKLKNVLIMSGGVLVLVATNLVTIADNISLEKKNEALKKETRILTDLNFMLVNELRVRKDD